ncbi:MAG: DUF3784 domain-containing protein [Oscillospiraceae bacterium]|nr:DUF3784 domain-containing protein [Oscillospiraceae bacterium]
MIICFIISAIFVVFGLLNFFQKIPLIHLYYIVQVKEKKAKMDKKRLYIHMGMGFIMCAIAFVLYAFYWIFDISLLLIVGSSLITVSILYFFAGASYKWFYENKKSKKK